MGGKLSLDLTCIISMEAMELICFGIILGMTMTVGIYHIAGEKYGNK